MVKESIEQIFAEMTALSAVIFTADFDRAAQAIVDAPRVFTAGAGRVGALMQCVTKRLMHTRIDAYVIGETTTPPAAAGDLLLVGSGSGETETLVVIAQKAKKLGLKILVITTNPASTLGQLADSVLCIPANAKATTDSGEGATSFQPMANLFEQMLHICGDALCIEVANLKGMDHASMFARHANLE